MGRRWAGVRFSRQTLMEQTFKDVVTGFIWSTGIALDVLGGKIYWTNTVEEKIQRADLNGANVQDVVTGLEINTLFLPSLLLQYLIKLRSASLHPRWQSPVRKKN